MTEDIHLIIKSCYDCPRFLSRRVRHFLIPDLEAAYRYTCTEANRQIGPEDGVKPPPTWCPKRKTKGEK